MTMTFQEESDLAERVLQRLRVRGAMPGYSIHRFGHELRFNQRWGLRYGEAGRFLIVSILGHRDGWVVAVATRPAGEFHDERAARVARHVVEQTLVDMGVPVGTPGREGQGSLPTQSRAQIERDVREVCGLDSMAAPLRPRSRRPRRTF